MRQQTMISRRTLRNGAIGAVVGSVLGFVPLVLLVAPVIGGGVTGSLAAAPLRQHVLGAVPDTNDGADTPSTNGETGAMEP